MGIDVVPVALGARSYEVRIGSGLIDRAGVEIAPLLRRKKAAIITDETVAAAHLARLSGCTPPAPKSAHFAALFVASPAAGLPRIGAWIIMVRALETIIRIAPSATPPCHLAPTPVNRIFWELFTIS